MTKEIKGIPFLITTTHQPTSSQIEEANYLAQEYGLVYQPRDHSLPFTYQSVNDPSLTGILVVCKNEYKFWVPDGNIFNYHPGMAVHRIKGLSMGRCDPMVEAMGLRSGDHVLDATAGLCSDALVCRYVVGDRGRVTAIESSLPVSLVVQKGLKTYKCERKSINELGAKIDLLCADNKEFLRNSPDKYWDIIYFDPMFRTPVLKSTGIDPLRRIADYSPLDRETLILAARCGKKAVVVKDRLDGPYYTSDVFSHTYTGSSNRRIGYAVLTGNKLKELSESRLNP